MNFKLVALLLLATGFQCITAAPGLSDGSASNNNDPMTFSFDYDDDVIDPNQVTGRHSNETETNLTSTLAGDPSPVVDESHNSSIHANVTTLKEDTDSLLMTILTRFLDSTVNTTSFRFRIFSSPPPQLSPISPLMPSHVPPFSSRGAAFQPDSTSMQMRPPFFRPYFPFYRSMWIPPF